MAENFVASAQRALDNVGALLRKVRLDLPRPVQEIEQRGVESVDNLKHSRVDVAITELAEDLGGICASLRRAGQVARVDCHGRTLPAVPR